MQVYGRLYTNRPYKYRDDCGGTVCMLPLSMRTALQEPSLLVQGWLGRNCPYASYKYTDGFVRTVPVFMGTAIEEPSLFVQVLLLRYRTLSSLLLQRCQTQDTPEFTPAYISGNSQNTRYTRIDIYIHRTPEQNLSTNTQELSSMAYRIHIKKNCMELSLNVDDFIHYETAYLLSRCMEGGLFKVICTRKI